MMLTPGKPGLRNPEVSTPFPRYSGLAELGLLPNHAPTGEQLKRLLMVRLFGAPTVTVLAPWKTHKLGARSAIQPSMSRPTFPLMTGLHA